MRRPIRRSLFRLCWLFCWAVAGTIGRAQTAAVPPVNTRDRAQVCDHYHLYYQSSNNVPPSWTGRVADGVPGTVEPTYLRATLLRINYFRAMCGLRNVVFDPVDNARCQQAAVMMAAAGTVSHDPPRSWKFYTRDAALAAAHSDLSLSQRGDQGPGAIDRYVDDFGSLNACVGHRRWLLNPDAKIMGAGIVPANDARHPGINVTWITDGLPRLIQVDDDLSPPAAAAAPAVSWPPPGFVPAALLYERWSFSLPCADFRRAIVQVAKEGRPLSLTQERPAYQCAADGAGANLGANTLVWTLPGNAVSRTVDETYRVRVSNVVVGGERREFAYTVTSIDPVGRGRSDPASGQDGKRLAGDAPWVR